MSNSLPILINGRFDTRLDPRDRGLAYGHGLFETLLLMHGKPVAWEAHSERLQRGAQRLGIPLGDRFTDLLIQDIDCLIGQYSDAEIPERLVLKVILTRGAGGRGYAVVGDMPVNRIVSLSDYPAYPGDPASEGIRTVACNTRLARSEQLAGIKHLNRLEQVLARAEWDDPAIREGLVCDTDGCLVEGTMSNLFWIKADTLFTPDLRYSGVAGIIRQQILAVATDLGLTAEIVSAPLSALQTADELFVCNSVIGLWPVTECIVSDHLTYQWPVGPTTRRIQQRLIAEGMF